MRNNLMEYFLYEHFLYECVLRQYYDKKTLYPCLKEIFFIEEEEAQHFASLEVVKEITTEEEYKRYLRIQQYNQLLGNPQICTDEEQQVIMIKGEAILVTTQSNLLVKPNTPSSMIGRNLMHYAKLGNLVAMRMQGLLQCEGIFLKKNKRQGIAVLEKASSWGDVVATLCLFKYERSRQNELLKRLNSIVKNTTYEDVLEFVMQKYEISTTEEQEEIYLLKKLFSNNKASHQSYNPMVARILYSPIIRFKDKEKILFSENKEILSEACDLPLKLTKEDAHFIDTSLKDLPIQRIEEQQYIARALKNMDLRTLEGYHPLCLSSESEYALNIYQKALQKNWENVHVELIEVSELIDQDFESTKNHILLRNIEEDKPNIYLFRFKGEITDRIFEKIIPFFQTEKRKKFYINLPAVCLDLSSILPICICDKENKERLKTYTEQLDILNITSEEKTKVILDIVEEKRQSYRLPQITLEPLALEKLCSYSLEFSEKALDKAVKEYRVPEEAEVLTLEMLEPYLKEKKTNRKNTYGFGGYIYENHK